MPEFTPYSRNEYLLNEIRKNTEGGGGGSGSGLPDVTDADNGKVLGVDAGDWVPIVNTIIITATMTSQTSGTWDSEYTKQQIATAFAQGARIVFNVLGVASVNVGWMDNYAYMYALVYMDGLGVLLIKASESGDRRDIAMIPVN